MNPSSCSLFLSRMFSRLRSHLCCRNPLSIKGILAVFCFPKVGQVTAIFVMVAVFLLATTVWGQEGEHVYRLGTESESERLIDQSRRARVKSEEMLAAIPFLVQRESCIDETLIGIDEWMARQAAGLYSIEFELNLGGIFEKEKSKRGQGVESVDKYSANENHDQIQVDRDSTFHPTVFAKPLDLVEPDRQKRWTWNPVPVMKLKTKKERQIAVANNLVDLGHYAAASKMLEKVLQTEKLDPLDHKWILFQLARSERKKKNPIEAEKWLRLIAGQGEKDIVSETAEWWLEQQDRRRQLQEGLEMETKVSDR